MAPRVQALFQAAERLAGISAWAGYWAPSSTVALWSGALAAMTPGRHTGGVSEAWQQLAIYPAALVAYSLGLGGALARRYDLLAKLFTSVVPNERNEWRPLVEVIHPYSIDERLGVHLREVRSKATPFSDHLHAVIRPAFIEQLPRQDHFDREFDRFELLLALAYYHLLSGTGSEAWVPLGRVRRLGRYREEVTRDFLEDQGSAVQPAAELLRLIGADQASIHTGCWENSSAQ